jgi:exosortase A-associated hydrolase 1
MSAGVERPLLFDCRGARLLGILARPEHVSGVGLLIVVGGPQYRAGSHRQFVRLARHAAAHGFAALRFDYRGMGDSDGAPRSFETIDEDISAAIDALMRSCPGMIGVALWGLCDGASAALMYAHRDRRVLGLALLNPWVRSEQTLARTHLRHYYVSRVLTPEFWSKLASGQLRVRESVLGLVSDLRAAHAEPAPARPAETYQQRMLEGLRRFRGRVLLILSGNDLTAREFEDHAEQDPHWRRLLAESRVQRMTVEDADHTFSAQHWQSEVERQTVRWLKSLEQ